VKEGTYRQEQRRNQVVRDLENWAQPIKLRKNMFKKLQKECTAKAKRQESRLRFLPRC